MAATDFPAIKAPKMIKPTPVDNTLKSSTDAGYVQARPRTTRPIYDFDVTLILNATDLAALRAHDALVTGASIFAWLNDDDGQTYQVRYTKRFTSSRSPQQQGWWDVSFTVQSV